MRPIPTLPYASVTNIPKWSNFHHTIVNRAIPMFVTPGANGFPAGVSPTAALSQSLNALLDYCVQTPPMRLTTLGSRWSLSNTLDPGSIVLEPAAWNQIAAVSSNWLTPGYQSRAAARKGVPIVVQGGATIRTLNNFLGNYNLALQTSGASDGHRIAGCIGTGTHGSHLKIGAVHDTVLGILLVTGPNEAVFLQPSDRNFTTDLTQWFRDSTTLQTSDSANDELFNAARVALGGLGFVHSVIVEAVPLYELAGHTIARPIDDPDIWNMIDTLDTTAIDPRPAPDFFSIVFSPYATGGTGSFATALWKQSPSQPYTGAPPVQSAAALDLTRLLSALIPVVDGGILGPAIGHVIAQMTAKQFQVGPVAPAFPGTYFGPTSLLEGNGRSVEVIVDHKHARPAVRTVLDTLANEAASGRHLLGAVGVRFVPKTEALLGMNIHAMNTYIELPSLQSADTAMIHNAVWNALAAGGIPFTCHWGQEYGMTASSIRAYYGDRVDRWRAARDTLLPTPEARAVFTTPLLAAMAL